MGSVGSVYTGNLLGTQVKSLIEGRVSSDGDIPDIIRVFANTNDDASYFEIDMRGMSQEERKIFLETWKRASNIHDKNARASYDKAFNAAKRETDPHTGQPVSDEDARKIAEIARAKTSYDALKRIQEKGTHRIRVTKHGF